MDCIGPLYVVMIVKKVFLQNTMRDNSVMQFTQLISVAIIARVVDSSLNERPMFNVDGSSLRSVHTEIRTDIILY